MLPIATPPPARGKPQPKSAAEVFHAADDVLRKVDASFIFTKHETREFPQFTIDELIPGSVLGKGGFSRVWEIVELKLSSDDVDGEAIALPPAPHDYNDEGEDDVNDPNLMSEKTSKQEESPKQPQLEHPESHHDDHIDFNVARTFMRKYCLRHGSARYAVKRLKDELTGIDRARGAVDLAIEIKFLSTLWHPNIIKMRGYSQTERVSYDTFLLLDRLYGTLRDKMENWRESMNVIRGTTASAGGCCGVGAAAAANRTPEGVALLQQRLLAAYDLTSALQYLHDRRLIYRDIKSENIGFDVRGDLKLFDFGFCKSLEQADKCEDGEYGYHLSIMTGTVPYMAPEVAMMKPYDKEADVYSFSVLLWELISLEWAYNGYDTKRYFFQVCAGNFRMAIPNHWPAIVKIIVKEGWDPNAQKRPTMKRIGALLRGELKDMTDDASVVNRTQHMMNRSRRSIHGQLETVRNNRLNGSRGGRATTMTSSRSQRDVFVGGDPCATDEAIGEK